MYSFPNLEPVFCSMSGSNCCFLTCIQISQEAVRWSGISISWGIFQVSFDLQNQMLWCNKAEVDVILELSCFFNDPMDIDKLISDSSAFSKSSLNIWKFMVHLLLKSGLENFEQYFASMWDECNCAVVWKLFVIVFLRDWNENSPFLVLWLLLSFPKMLAYWVQHFHIIFQDLK